MAVFERKKVNGEWIRLTVKTAGGVLLSVLFIAALWAIVHVAVGNDYLLPSLGDTFAAGWLLLGVPAFWTSFLFTLLRALQAFFIAFGIAVFLAVISCMVPFFRTFLQPIVSVMRSLPTMAVLLILHVSFSPLVSPVIVAFLALFPILYTSMMAALESVDKDLIEMSKVYRVPLIKRIFQMYLPLAAPYLLRESAGALAFSVKLIVSAEIMANTYKSLGGLLQDASNYTNMPQTFALTVFAVLAGLILEGLGILLARLAERRTR